MYRPRRARESPLFRLVEQHLGEFLVRGERPEEEVTGHGDEQESPKRRRCSPSWARLIAKVFRVVAYITDTVAIRRILDHLGLGPPEKPPPEVREVVRAPVDDEGREVGANPA